MGEDSEDPADQRSLRSTLLPSAFGQPYQRCGSRWWWTLKNALFVGNADQVGSYRSPRISLYEVSRPDLQRRNRRLKGRIAEPRTETACPTIAQVSIREDSEDPADQRSLRSTLLPSASCKTVFPLYCRLQSNKEPQLEAVWPNSAGAVELFA